jgi:hypothetical protein
MVGDIIRVEAVLFFASRWQIPPVAPNPAIRQELADSNLSPGEKPSNAALEKSICVKIGFR